MSGMNASTRRIFDPIEQIWEIDQDLAAGNLVGASRRLLDLVNNFPQFPQLREAANISRKTRASLGSADGYATEKECREAILSLSGNVIDQLQRLVPADEVSIGEREDYARLLARVLDLIQAGGRGIADAMPQATIGQMRAFVQRTAAVGGVVATCAGIRKKVGTIELELPMLELRRGEITGVVAENAHGKTTLLRLIAGDLRLHGGEGEMRYPGLTPGTDAQGWSQLKQQIAYVPQALPLWHGSLRETLHAEAAMHGVKGEDNRGAVEFIVERLGLADHLERRWDQLSGGYRLRFALARALVCKPKLQLLVLDEPLANLDGLVRAALVKDLRHLSGTFRHPIAVVLSSHDIQSVESVCSQIVVLRKGRAQIHSDEHPVQTGGFGKFEIECDLSAKTLAGRLAGSRICKVEESHLITLLTAPADMSRAQVLQTLLDHGVEPLAFRDISRSVRRIFHDA